MNDPENSGDDDILPASNAPFIVDAMSTLAVSEKLRELTEASGLTQAEIARRAGLNRDAYGRYLSGKTRCPDRKLIAIARVFGILPSQIDESRKALDSLSDAIAATNQQYVIKPGTGSLVRIEFSAEVSVDKAAAIVKILNGSD